MSLNERLELLDDSSGLLPPVKFGLMMYITSYFSVAFAMVCTSFWSFWPRFLREQG